MPVAIVENKKVNAEYINSIQLRNRFPFRMKGVSPQQPAAYVDGKTFNPIFCRFVQKAFGYDRNTTKDCFSSASIDAAIRKRVQR